MQTSASWNRDATQQRPLGNHFRRLAPGSIFTVVLPEQIPIKFGQAAPKARLREITGRPSELAVFGKPASLVWGPPMGTAADLRHHRALCRALATQRLRVTDYRFDSNLP